MEHRCIEIDIKIEFYCDYMVCEASEFGETG